MVLGLHVAGTGVDLGFWELALELGDFLGALVDEQDHEMEVFGMAFAGCLGQVKEEGGLAGAGWRNDQTPLTTTNRSDHVDDPRGESL